MSVIGLSWMNSPAHQKPAASRCLPQLLTAVVVFLAFFAPALMSAPTASAQPAQWAPPRTVYVPATGHSVDGYFLDVWRTWGIVNLGYPITPEIVENDHLSLIHISEPTRRT